MKNVGILIQARIASTRLPGKVLFQLGKTNFNSISLMNKRLDKKEINEIAEVVIITSNNKCDDSIEYLCKREKLEVFRGSEKDVLDRYFQAAIKFKFHTIIRLTSDCPFIDYKEVSKILKIHNYNNNDYTTNSFQGSTIVDGCDVEVFSFAALKRAHRNTHNMKDREHVTTFFTKENNFKISLIDPKFKLPYTRLTLDTPEDYEVISQIIDLVDDPINIDIETLGKIYYQRKLNYINNFIKRNSGWNK